MYSNCNVCPRKCGANRDAGVRGICGQTNEIKIARAALHMWEEPCISGKRGSGTIFFSGCNLHCVFCQNYKIANSDVGHIISVEQLTEEMLKLQELGANNINLVTATHFVPSIIKSVESARNQGMNLPIVYNTSSYENVDTIKMLEGIVDVYLPDLKYVSSELSTKYSHAADYFQVASEAIDEMVRQTRGFAFTAEAGNPKQEIMTRGTIVRHLVLPGCVEDSKLVLDYLLATYGEEIFISIMNQYTPLEQVQVSCPELYRKVSTEEYSQVLDYAYDLGIENGFIQEGDVAQESFIPEFE